MSRRLWLLPAPPLCCCCYDTLLARLRDISRRYAATSFYAGFFDITPCREPERLPERYFARRAMPRGVVLRCHVYAAVAARLFYVLPAMLSELA